MRTRAFSLILILCLLFLVSGLAYVQISRHEAYRIMSEDNRLKVIPLMAPRGCIYDRNGKAMVKDEISFNVAVIYSQIKDREALTEILSSILGLSGDEVRKGREKARRQPYTLTNIASDIGIEKAVHLEEVVMDHPGLLLDVSTKRRYLEKNAASNLLGYLGLINREEFEKLKPYGYRFDDLVGRDGIEKYYDQYLRGAHGGKQIEVDHMGREMTTLGYKEPVPGRDVYLTVDLELQRYCDELLEGKRGSIIAMDPRTGDVLAMASAPNYNPEIFTRSGNGSEVKKILRDKDYPLLNRAISGSYPLGSVFKIVVATGALETGKASRDKRFHCPGSFSLGRKTFRCWRKDGHGSQTMEEAIKNSCNVYFYQLGLLLGVDDISSFAGKLGMGELTGIDLPGETKGLLPTRKWKRKRFNEKWFKGETVNLAIGQGYLLCTPLQIARMMSFFANGGFLVHPYLVKKVGEVNVENSAKVKLEISQETVETIRRGLWLVVNDPTGTGQNAMLADIEVAGKTGTAQTARGRNHGWFAGFAPFDDPKLTVVVFDEYGGKGGYYAAGTASKVFGKARALGII